MVNLKAIIKGDLNKDFVLKQQQPKVPQNYLHVVLQQVNCGGRASVEGYLKGI